MTYTETVHSFKRVLRHAPHWVWGTLCVFIIALIALGVLNFFENKGELKDVNFLLKAVSQARSVSDLTDLDWYLNLKIAERLSDPPYDVNLIMAYQYMKTVIESSSGERKASDLKYSLYILRENYLKQYPRFLVSFLTYKDQFEDFCSLLVRMIGKATQFNITSDEKLFKQAREIREKEYGLNHGDKVKYYEALVGTASEPGLRPYLALKMAYLIYEESPDRAIPFLKEVIGTREKMPDFIKDIAEIMLEKINESRGVLKRFDGEKREIETDPSPLGRADKCNRLVSSLLRVNQIAKALSLLESVSFEGYSANVKQKLLLIKGWIELDRDGARARETLSPLMQEADSKSTKVLAEFFINILNLKERNYSQYAESAKKIAESYDQETYAPSLKFQTWGVLYYDAKDLPKADEALKDLKMKYPAQGWSYPERGAKTFKIAPPGQALIVFNLFKTLFPKAVAIFKVRVGLLAQRLRENEFERFFTEEEFDRFVVVKLKDYIPPILTNIRVAIHENGFDGSSMLKLKILNLPVTGAGIVSVDPENENMPYMKLYWMKIGPLAMPEFMLRDLEDIFRDSTQKGNFPLEILEMKYQEKGILIKCRKTAGTEKRTPLSSLTGIGVSRGEYAY